MAGIDGTPLCQFCKHHHHQGIKCEICGHVGKSNLYGKMRIKAAQLHSYHIEITNSYPCSSSSSSSSSTLASSSSNDDDGLWEICYEIRKNIFCHEFQYLENEEFDEIDPNSRHVVGFVGDMPVLALRWHLLSHSNGDNSAIIDRCAVIPAYRNKKFSSKTIELVIKDIQQVSNHHQISISSLQILVPQHSALEECLLRHGYLPSSSNPNTENIIMRGGVPHRYVGQYFG